MWVLKEPPHRTRWNAAGSFPGKRNKIGKLMFVFLHLVGGSLECEHVSTTRNELTLESDAGRSVGNSFSSH